LRYTVLIADREAWILIPNSTLFTNSITVSARGSGDPRELRSKGTETLPPR
jgi:hypothetical protein